MVVLDIGRLHEHGQQRTFRIGDDMTLATLDPLRHVKSTRAATFRGFHSLAVDDAGGGTKLAPLPLAHLGNQGVIDQTPQSRSTPLVEVISNGRTRRKILWQRAPLTSRARDVEDRIYDDTQIGLAWPATSARCRHKRFNQFPLLIRRIACITQFVAPILFAGDFSPRHVVCSLVLSQARRNHNGLESLNFLFRSDFQGDGDISEFASCTKPSTTPSWRCCSARSSSCATWAGARPWCCSAISVRGAITSPPRSRRPRISAPTPMRCA